MKQTDENHYHYFGQLDRRIKTAIAIYAFFLLGGLTISVFDVDPFRSLFVPISWRGPVIAILLAGMLAVSILLTLRQIPHVSRVNAWFDKRLFGLMETSDTILKNSILAAATGADPVRSSDRSALAECIVRRLSEHDQIYRTLLESGIFPLWAWYWIAMYGSIAFSALVVLAFCTIAPGLSPDLRILFPWYLAFALGHITVTLIIGRRIERLTRKAAETIASSYRADIETIIRDYSPPPSSGTSPPIATA
jgi:hypothetical protein